MQNHPEQNRRAGEENSRDSASGDAQSKPDGFDTPRSRPMTIPGGPLRPPLGTSSAPSAPATLLSTVAASPVPARPFRPADSASDLPQAATPAAPAPNRSKSPSWQRRLYRAITDFTALLSRDFAPQIGSDPRGFKKTVVHQIKRLLPPGPGRLPLEAITRAIKLRAQNVDWKDIYAVCIPGYSELGRAERHLAASNLRAACRSRLNARRRRAHSAHPSRSARRRKSRH